MIVATELTAGERPRCIECGAFASYVELHATWKPTCTHPLRDYTTEAQLIQEHASAHELANTAHKRLVKWARLPLVPRHEYCYRGRASQECLGCTNVKYCSEHG